MKSLINNGNSFNENFKILEERINNLSRGDTSNSSPTGSNGDIQFNTGGSLAASSDLNWDNINKCLSVSTLKIGSDSTNPFIGTLVNKPIIFKTNNAESFRILATGDIDIAYTKKLRTSSAGIELRRGDDNGSGTTFATIQYTAGEFINFNKTLMSGTGVFGHSNFGTNSVSLQLNYGGTKFQAAGAGTGSWEWEFKTAATALQGLLKVTNNTTSVFEIKQTNNVLIGLSTDSGDRLQVKGNLLLDSANANYAPCIKFTGNGANLAVIGGEYNGSIFINVPQGKQVLFGPSGSAIYTVMINTYPYSIPSSPNNYVQRITSPATTAELLQLKSLASQTGHFINCQNNLGVTLSSIKSDGTITAPKVIINGDGIFNGNVESSKLLAYNTNSLADGQQLISLEDLGQPVGLGFVTGCAGADLENISTTSPVSVSKTIYFVQNPNGVVINTTGFWWFDFDNNVWLKL